MSGRSNSLCDARSPQLAARFALLRCWSDRPAPRGKAAQAPDLWSLTPVTQPRVACRSKRRPWRHTPIDHFILAPLEARGWQPARAVSSGQADPPGLFRSVGPAADAGGRAGLRGRRAARRLRAAGRPLAGQPALRRALGPLLARPGAVCRDQRLRARRARSRTPGSIATGSSTSLNDDMPYDRFVLEQLAGDELPDASDADADRHRLPARGHVRRRAQRSAEVQVRAARRSDPRHEHGVPGA